MIKNKLLKYTLSIVLSALIALHISKWIFIGVNINQITIPALFVMIFAMIKEDRKIYFLSFVLMGIVSIITLKNPDDLTPVLMFFIALLYYGNFKSLIICIASIPTAYMINMFIMHHEEFYNIPVGILGNVGVLIFLYLAVIRQPSNIDHLSKVTPLSKRQLLILKYLAAGVSRKEMPEKVPERELWKHDIEKFSFHIINSEISDIKTSLDIESEFELGIWYNKKTEISRNPSNT